MELIITLKGDFMKKSYIIIIAICVFALAVAGGFFGAKLLSEKPEETEAPSTTVEETTQATTVEETVLVTETETVTETEIETTVPTTEAKAEEIINTDYYSITIPASWQGKYTYKITNVEGNDGYSLSMCHKDSYGVGYGGKLFIISLFSVEEGSGKELIENAPVPIDYLGVLKVPGVGDFDVIVAFPSDAQFNDSTMDGYNELYNANESVYKTLTPTNGATFEKAQ